jgi:signal transduction histidine kinase
MAIVSLGGRIFEESSGMRNDGLRREGVARIERRIDLACRGRKVELEHIALAWPEISHFDAKRYRHGDGRTVWGWLSVSLVRDAVGNPLYFVSQVQDLTDRKRLEEQLRHSQKMEAIGRLAGGIAHDFNNIITVISTYGGLLEERLPSDDFNREAVRARRRRTSYASHAAEHGVRPQAMLARWSISSRFASGTLIDATPSQRLSSQAGAASLPAR